MRNKTSRDEFQELLNGFAATLGRGVKSLEDGKYTRKEAIGDISKGVPEMWKALRGTGSIDPNDISPEELEADQFAAVQIFEAESERRASENIKEIIRGLSIASWAFLKEVSG